MVSLIERDHANVSFCSNHILGTALPPPSVGGLRPNSLVTCGFAALRPALSRRPRAVGAGTTRFPRTCASSAKARGCNLPHTVGVQFVPVLTSFARRARHAPAAVGRDRTPPSRPRSRRLARALPLLALGLRPPRASRSRLASFISELASHEVPGLGAPALPSALGLEALASALAIREGPRRLRIRPAVAILPPPPRQPAGVPSADTRPSLPVQRHPRGSNRVGEEGRVIGELSRRAARRWWVGDGGPRECPLLEIESVRPVAEDTRVEGKGAC
jgi:hypothetical protein